MEKEMLNKILEEVKSLRTEMNERFEAVDKRFEDMDSKFEGKLEELDNKFERKFEGLNDRFEGLNDRFEGLNAEVKEIKTELKQFRKDFESHDRGQKMVWEEFENNIGEELEKLDEKVEGNALQILYIKNAVRKLLNIHKKELKLAEKTEKYEADENQE